MDNCTPAVRELMDCSTELRWFDVVENGIDLLAEISCRWKSPALEMSLDPVEQPVVARCNVQAVAWVWHLGSVMALEVILDDAGAVSWRVVLLDPPVLTSPSGRTPAPDFLSQLPDHFQLNWALIPHPSGMNFLMMTPSQSHQMDNITFTVALSMHTIWGLGAPGATHSELP